MATLAEVLRGYQPPTTSALADPIKEHFRNLPETTAQNAINMNNMVQNAMPYNPQTHQFEKGPTFSEFANYVPNMMGSVKNIIGPLTRMETAQVRAALPYAEGGLNLPVNNTAMQRARAMGFETAPSKELYHGSRGELVGNIDPTKSDFGFHVGTAEQAQERLKTFGNRGIDYPEGANISPMLKSKYANFLTVKDQGGFHADELLDQLRGNKNIDQSVIKKLKDKMMTDTRPSTHSVMKEYDDVLREQIKQQGYQGLKYMNNTEGQGMSYAVSDPSILRSRFAAFDPYMEKSTNPMAGALAVPLVDEDTRKAMLEKLFKEQK